MKSPTFSTMTGAKTLAASLTPESSTSPPPQLYFAPREGSVPLQRLTCFLWNYIHCDGFFEAVPPKFSPFLSDVGPEYTRHASALRVEDLTSICVMNRTELLNVLEDESLCCCMLEDAEVVGGSPQYALIAVWAHKDQRGLNGEKKWMIEAIAQVNDEFGRCLKAVVPLNPANYTALMLRDPSTHPATMHTEVPNTATPTTAIRDLNLKLKVIFTMDRDSSMEELLSLGKLLNWERIVKLLRFSIRLYTQGEDTSSLADMDIKCKASESFVVMSPVETVAREWVLKISLDLENEIWVDGPEIPVENVRANVEKPRGENPETFFDNTAYSGEEIELPFHPPGQQRT